MINANKPGFMKRFLLSLVMVLAVSFSASSQLLLNTGDSYHYSFSQVPLVGTGAVVCVYSSRVTLGLTPSTFNEGDSFQIALHASNGTLFGSGTISYSTQPPEISFAVFGPPSGEISVRMVSGSATLETIGFTFVQPRCDEPGIFPSLIYGTVVAVPEPTTVSLAAILGVTVLAWRLRRPGRPT